MQKKGKKMKTKEKTAFRGKKHSEPLTRTVVSWSNSATKWQNCMKEYEKKETNPLNGTDEQSE